jgi:hypothetical protein
MANMTTGLMSIPSSAGASNGRGGPTRAASPLPEDGAMTPTIYTIGYRQPNVEEQLAALTVQGYHLADIRRRAGSRYKPDYNRWRLAYRFADYYHRLRELGNENYQRPGEPFVLVDQDAGLDKVERIINERSQGQGIILLCACANWQDCHRAYVADLLLDRLPGAQVKHIQSDDTHTRVTQLENHMELEYKRYRKITPSRLRPLTEQDYRERSGIIQTREGPATFQPGDFLGQDSKGEFRVRRVKVERDFRQISEACADGWISYQPLDTRLAAQLAFPRDLPNGQHGEAGDYVVQGTDSQWIVACELFEASYVSVDNKQAGSEGM